MHSLRYGLLFLLTWGIYTGQLATAAAPADKKPHVLFIALDDLNDWIGCLGGHPQTRTPNLDRLAARSVLFTNAHCPAPACNPSRSAIFTGRAPNRSGMYDNRQRMREVMPNEVLLPQHFRNHGYRAAGSGKMLHYFIDKQSWDDYFPKPESENPLPRTFYPKKRPASLPRGGPWQYVETDWAALDVNDKQFGGDWLVSKWIGEQLAVEPAADSPPWFLACGLYRPHEPWFVPKKYFEPFPLESIQLPPGYRENDLDDVPAAGVRRARNRYFAHIQKHDQWRQGIQGYLASIHFADAMLGRVLDALDRSPYADNTIVVLWADHGWQLGEKEHWQKYTGWRAVTRVPLMIHVPQGVSSSLPNGTSAGARCDAPVNLLSLFPTLTDLCGLPESKQCDGPKLTPLLIDPDADQQDWPHYSVTCLAQPGAYSVSGWTHRFIHYEADAEELYDIRNDPFEWTNVVDNSQQAAALQRLQAAAPKTFAQRKAPSIQSLVKLKWHAANGKAPPSNPDGNPFRVHFKNNTTAMVELFWMGRNGEPKSYGQIDVGATRSQQTRPGAVWMIRDVKSGKSLGHFRVGDRTAQAIIP